MGRARRSQRLCCVVPGLLLAIVAVSPRAGATELQIRFIGNAAFAISDGEVTILTDFPYRSGAFGYMEYERSSVQPQGPVLCLISHRHADHFDPRLLEETDWKVLAPADTTRSLPAARLLAVVDGEASFGDVRIEAIATPHADVDHLSYRLTWGALSLYLTGDTEETETLRRQGHLDALFITPWLLDRLRAKGIEPPADQVFVYHHTAGQRVDCSRCVVPRQGEVFTVAPRRRVSPPRGTPGDGALP